MSMLELKNVSKDYKISGNKVFQALKNINVSFEKGELVSIVGESGSGKSTLMNLIGGLDSTFTGEVCFEGRNLGTFTEKELDAYRKNKIGFVFQSFNLIPHLSVLDNVTIAMTLSNVSKKERIERAEEILTEVGLKNHMSKKPNQLSGGQKQRVAIARALINNPEIIIADEPTGALDSETTGQVLEIITKIAQQGKLVIMVTHSDKVAAHSSRIVRIADGEIIADDKTREIELTEKKAVNVPKDKQNLSLFSAIKLALNNMKEKFGRNVLVSFGASIGIASVVLMLSLGSGLTGYVNSSMNSMVNPLFIEVNMPKVETDSNAPKVPILQLTKEPVVFTQADIDKVTSIANIESYELGFSETSFGSNSVEHNDKTSSVMMVSTISQNITEKNIKEGNLPGKNEILISQTIATDLGLDEVIGTEVTFNVKVQKQLYSSSFVVSGIYESGSGMEQMDALPMVYLNYSDLESIVADNGDELKPTTLYLMSNATENTATIKAKVKDLGFTGSSQEFMASTFTGILDILTYALTAISAISLIVSAIMILVVLYISVVERTQEIGVLKAIGARGKDIKRIFVSESFLIGLFSGLIGVTSAFLLSLVVNIFSRQNFDTNIVVVNWQYILAGITVSVVISVISGLIPASMAAKLDPVDSLRHE